MITNFDQLDLNKRYSYADYLTWRFKERVELILGKVFRMSPAPSSSHQGVSALILGSFLNYLKGKPCKVFHAPFDVRLPKNVPSLDADVETVVQPDICVICDLAKIDEKGCSGAPDLVVEIVSKSSVQRDLQDKYALYESAGVKEYWIVYPIEKSLSVFLLDNGNYVSSRPLTIGDRVRSQVLPDIDLDLGEIFQDIVQEPKEDYGSRQIRLDP